MIKIGLTGSIGMGKSTVLAMFSDLGAAVWNADDAVHRLYSKGGTGAKAVGSMFPDAIVDGAVDRRALAGLVLGDAQALQSLEEIIHPLVAADREGFMDAAAHAGALVAVLDIPLLFENGTEKFFDATVVVSAPADIQRARVLARPGMTTEKFEAILKLQTPDADKRKLANYVIDTGVAIEETKRQVAAVYTDIVSAATGD
ncbi:dephospho-CoA kinase [Hyphococcus sp.]|uniref:dephospho-CoA kinase n=1 Tax=Hyphococcus sp. TaxID=2038636 RepID=UPI00208C6D4A|nr:MAG: dephospho-CoA kinase [Marinicaulis sp.]